MKYSIKPLSQEMEKFGYRYGIGMAETLSALLDYIIGCMDPEGKPVEGWRYNKEQNECFHTMMSVYFNVMQDALAHDGWHDAFGDIFMEWAGSKNALGQCFTPACMCDMMAECTFGDTKPDTPKVNCKVVASFWPLQASWSAWVPKSPISLVRTSMPCAASRQQSI